MYLALLAALSLLAVTCNAAPAQSLDNRQSTDRYVFAHFMMGIVNRQTSNEYDADFNIAKAASIDAFALNIGPDVSNTQLEYAYDSAARIGMKVFISFDFNDGLFSTGDAKAVGDRIKAFKDKPAQLIVDGKPFVSTFVGQGLNVAAVKAAAGSDLFFVPNWPANSDQTGTDGLFNWSAWPSSPSNTPSTSDTSYLTSLTSPSRYMAPISPWFSTHYGPNIPYPKNFVFQSNALWSTRWAEILALGPRFVEIITWNDFGESSYVGPLASSHNDDGSSKWVDGMPHGGWLDMAKLYIRAYKAGRTEIEVKEGEEKLIYWHRPTPKGVTCSDDTLGKPNGWELLTDEVFVVALLKTPGTVSVTSGGVVKEFQAPAGASLHTMGMGVGKQTFKLGRNGTEVFGAVSGRDVVDRCVCGVYNFNAYVGTVPGGAPDGLVDKGAMGAC